MRNFIRYFFFIGLTLALGAACAGQQPKPAPRVETRVDISPPDTSNDRVVGQATASYIPEEGRTLVSTELVLIEPRGYRSTDLGVGFVVAGKKVVKPETVKFWFSTRDESQFFKRRVAVKVQTDRALFNLSKVVKRLTPSEIGTEQEITAELDFQSFERAANSGETKILVGQFEFVLAEKHREALRDLLRTIEP